MLSLKGLFLSQMKETKDMSPTAKRRKPLDKMGIPNRKGMSGGMEKARRWPTVGSSILSADSGKGTGSIWCVLFVNACIVNAFILYKEKSTCTLKKTYGHLDFRMKVADDENLCKTLYSQITQNKTLLERICVKYVSKAEQQTECVKLPIGINSSRPWLQIFL